MVGWSFCFGCFEGVPLVLIGFIFSFVCFFLYRMFSSVAHCHISRTVRLSPCDILYWMFDIESCLKIYFVQICFVYMFRWMLLGFFSIVVFWSFFKILLTSLLLFMFCHMHVLNKNWMAEKKIIKKWQAL